MPLKQTNNHQSATRNGQVKRELTSDPSRVSGKRCAHLITVAMANRLSEVWIANHPILLFVFVSQYAPVLFRW